MSKSPRPSELAVCPAMRRGSFLVPGSKETVKVPKRRKKTPVMRTPAMRLGADPIEDPKKTQRPPDPRRVLYRPWLFHGTPLWRKFEDR